MTVPLYVLDMAELAPEQIVRLEPGRVVVLDQRRLPDEEVELECALGGRGRGGDPDARRPRRAGDRRRRRVRVRARRRAGGGPRGRGRRPARVAPDGGQPRVGARPDARRSERGARTPDPRGRGRALPRDGTPRRRRSSTGPVGVLTHCNTGGLATGGYGTALGAIRARLGARARRAGVGGRDAAAAPGRSPDGVGARAARNPVLRRSPTQPPPREWRPVRSAWS